MSQSDHIAHIIHTAFFSGKEFCRLDSAFSEYASRVCRMFKFDHFVCSRKDHLMFPYDRTSAKS